MFPHSIINTIIFMICAPAVHPARPSGNAVCVYGGRDGIVRVIIDNKHYQLGGHDYFCTVRHSSDKLVTNGSLDRLFVTTMAVP